MLDFVVVRRRLDMLFALFLVAIGNAYRGIFVVPGCSDRKVIKKKQFFLTLKKKMFFGVSRVAAAGTCRRLGRRDGPFGSQRKRYGLCERQVSAARCRS